MNALVRFAPATGVIAVVLFVIAAIIGGETPDVDVPGEEVLSFYGDDESAQFAGNILGAYGALFLVFFVSVLRSVLGRAEDAQGGPGVASTIAFGGGLLMALGILAFAGFGFTLADGHDSLEPAAAQALNALSGDFFLPLAVGTAAFLLGSAISIIRTGVLPAWLGWVAAVIGVLAVTPIGFFAFLAGLIWILIASVMLFTARPLEPAGAAGNP